VSSSEHKLEWEVIETPEELKSAGDPDPKLDCGECSVCGWSGKLSECETAQEGNCEEGYVTAAYCPVCEDGGCIENFYPSGESLAEWEKEQCSNSG
jgi:hypothetical protein